MIVDPLFMFLEPILSHVTRLSSISDDPDLTLGISFFDELSRRFV